MGRVLSAFFVLSLLLGCASSPASSNGVAQSSYIPPADSVVLRVEVVAVEFTDLYPDCGQVKDYVPFHFWWRYRARVKEVVSGTWAQPEVEFTHLQHAQFINRVTKDCYIVLVPAGEDIRSNVGVALVADKLLSRFFKSDRAVIRALRNGI